MFGHDNSFPILFYLFEKGYLIPLYPPLSKGGYIFPPFGKGRRGGILKSLFQTTKLIVEFINSIRFIRYHSFCILCKKLHWNLS